MARRVVLKWRGLQPAGFSPSMDQTPQAEARATYTASLQASSSERTTRCSP